MFRLSERGFALAFACAAIILTLSGCEQSPNPRGDIALSALESSLTAWKSGKAPASLADGKPPIQAIDGEWVSGIKLADFEIISEEPSTKDKRFKVKLKYKSSAPTKAAAEQEVVYIVIGIDPVSVFREDDYNRSLNMDNNPTAKPARKSR